MAGDEGLRVLQTFEQGNACYQAGQYAEAAECYRDVLRAWPAHVESHNNLGAALADLGRLDEALACYLRALQLQPAYADASYNLGNALHRAGHHAAAAASYQRAVDLQPSRPQFQLGLANALARTGQLALAEAAYRRALALQPDFPAACTGLGLLLAEKGKFAEAEACHDAAIQLDPDFPEAHRNRSLVRLLQGRFVEGWDDYEWRWRCPDFAFLKITRPRWDGRPLPEGTILLYSEQGYGDAMQFVRYAPLVKERVGQVVLATRPELIPLLRTCRGIDRLTPLVEDLPPFDVHCPLMSLPGLLGTIEAAIPRQVPYLAAQPERTARWRSRLELIPPGPRVGLCWRGSPGNQYYREHGVPPESWALLAELRGIHWVSLQKDAGRRERDALRLQLADYSAELDVEGGAFLDSAALISVLDLVISFDTAIVHLAGALGRPIWILLPKVPEWRWLLGRDDSPWYPTARLFRQESPRCWDAPLQAIRERLRRMV